MFLHPPLSRPILNEPVTVTIMDFYLHQIRQAVLSATHDMTPDQLRWRPEGRKWNVSEVLEHLSLTYSGTRIAFERCLQAGKPSATSPTLKERARALVVVKLGHMPNGREAPAGTRPKGAPAESILAHIEQQIETMDDAIRRCEERFGSHTKLANHPILGPLTAAEWRRFHWVHARHHMKQIERLRREAPAK